MSHRSRLCHFVIDVGDLAEGLLFWGAALHATEEPVNEGSEHLYRRLVVPGSDVRILLQLTDDEKEAKSRMHLDIEAEDVEAEVRRLESKGAVRTHHRTDRGYDFWVMLDPWANEFCVLQPTRSGSRGTKTSAAVELSQNPLGGPNLGPPIHTNDSTDVGEALRTQPKQRRVTR